MLSRFLSKFTLGIVVVVINVYNPHSSKSDSDKHVILQFGKTTKNDGNMQVICTSMARMELDVKTAQVIFLALFP